MAHNLATINGQVSYAYQGSTPWHGLGTRTHGLTNVADALSAANLNWTVELQDVFLSDSRRVPDRKAVVRNTDSAILGTVGPAFQPLQNAEAFGVLDEACRDFGVTIESIGALGNGARTFALAKLPETIEPIEGDSIKGYFLIQNGHDGSLSYGAKATPIRVVCQNTLNVANTGNKDLITLRHSRSIGDRKDEVAKLLKGLLKAFRETGDTFATLAAKKLNHAQVLAYIESVFPATGDDLTVSDNLARRRVIVHDLVYNGKGAGLAGSDLRTLDSTPWAVYNAVTEFVDHVQGAEAKSKSAQLSAATSALFGTGAAVKLTALKQARQLVAA